MAKQGSKANKRILKAKIDFLSLCPRGANTLQTVYKDEDGKDKNVSFSVLSKDMSEQGELIACVYCPELVDGQGDVASAEVIKEMAYGFAAEGQGIDIRHNSKPVSKEDAFVAESFIIQNGDPRFAGMKNYAGAVVDVTGGWGVVLKIENEELRKLYKSGEWGGISMGGLMLTKAEDVSAVDKMCAVISKAFEKFLPKKDTEIDMDAKEFKAALAENNTALVTALKEALKPEATNISTEKAAKEATGTKKGLGYPKPVLKAAPTEADIEQFSKESEIYELSQQVNPDNFKDVLEFHKAAKEIAQGKSTASAARKEATSPYGSFFASNQEIKKSSSEGGEDSMADAILAEMEKEEKAGK
jgi:hypothetical protein